MAHDRLRESALVHALRDLYADLADLLQKEMRLARAEIGQMAANARQAGIWFAVAGTLGFIALLLLAQAAVFAIASFGLALYWSSLIVAVIAALVAAAAVAGARAAARDAVTPRRTVKQIREDVSTAREQLS